MRQGPEGVVKKLKLFALKKKLKKAEFKKNKKNSNIVPQPLPHLLKILIFLSSRYVADTVAVCWPNLGEI